PRNPPDPAPLDTNTAAAAAPEQNNFLTPPSVSGLRIRVPRFGSFVLYQERDSPNASDIAGGGVPVGREVGARAGREALLTAVGANELDQPVFKTVRADSNGR
ncbi:hypothetical protein U1Q18_029441, partial [Sarracenia purpurea var. burkii]